MIDYHVHFNFSTKEELPLSTIQGRLLSAFTNLEGFSIETTACIENWPRCPVADSVLVPADHANAGHIESPAEPELAAPAVSDPPVVADDTPAGSVDPTATVTKDQLKEKLFDLRDAKGADAVKALYEKCGNGAKTLKTLDESCYTEMYNQAVMLLAE